jgi:hypothetical protein
MDKKIKCPKCGRELLQFNEAGQHNFCPTSKFAPGKIVHVCMKCKIEEVVDKWKNV